MSKVKFDLDLQGLNALMKSPEMQSVLQQTGDAVASRATAMASNAKAEYEAVTYPIRWIAVTNVRCANSEAIRENLKNNTLLKALGGSK